MKTRNVIAILCAITLCLGFAVSSFAGIDPGTGIKDSPHDLSVLTDDNRLCAFCHTPHHAVDMGSQYAPLWSRSDIGVAGYAQYDSTTIDSTTVDQLIGPSRLCMSCHDGVVAVDAYYGSTGDVDGGGAVINVGDDSWGGYGVGLVSGLSNDHPIGFIYDATLVAADGELNPTTTPFVGNTAMTIYDALYEPAPGAGNLFMTCATCHDVHNTDNVDDYFLLGEQNQSGICLTCHDK